MPRAEGNVPNLINGVSQQTAASRLISQGEAIENFYPSILKGLDKRPRTEHLASLGIDLPDKTFTHIILRDATEKYIVAILPGGTIRVWDFEGNEKTVTNSGTAYIPAPLLDPEADLRALTIADHTFIVNKKKVVSYGSGTTATRPYEAMVNVMAGNYGKTYRIRVNGSVQAEYETPNGGEASHAPYVDTVQIASQLHSDLVAGVAAAAPWSTGRYHSTIYIRNTTTDFSISTEDGYGGRAMKEVKKRVQKFTDLPQFGPDGVVMEVVGDEATGFDNYWVEFEKANAADGAGVWRECVAPATRLGLEGNSMPHVLVRNEDGTFTFKSVAWDQRKCGDLEMNPDPSFVGQTIEDIFFHRNRLGLLTKENVVMSESGKFYNFYRTTLTALLDTDPIDVAASHVKVSLLRHAVPYSDLLLLFSDQTQFTLKGNELLTPKTVNARPLSENAAHPVIRPVSVGTSTYFLAEREGYAALIEYFIDKGVENADTEDVSSHAPTYIPAGVHRLAASSELDLLFVASKGDEGALYGYKFYWSGEEKVQSAWFRWRLPGVSKVYNIEFDRGQLIVLCRRGTEVCLEKINCEQGLRDSGMEFRARLDRHVLKTTGSYNAGTNKTTFTLPYTITSDYVTVTAPGGSMAANVKLVPTIAANTIILDGDLSAQPIRVGLPYESVYEFSEFFLRAEDGRTADVDGRLQILSMAVIYSECASFLVEVEIEGRPTKVYPFTGRVVSDPDNVLGEVALDSGRFSFPIMSRSDRVTVRIKNASWLPGSFLSAKWRGVWNPNSRQQ